MTSNIFRIKSAKQRITLRLDCENEMHTSCVRIPQGLFEFWWTSEQLFAQKITKQLTGQIGEHMLTALSKQYFW